jgi:hypothetical protein
MTLSSERTSRFLVMWCNEGLETLINITRNEQENIIAVLKDEPIPHTNPIHNMILRAKFNSHRHYEIYVFDSELDEEDIKAMFDSSPQVIVDAIRKVGHRLYCDRAQKSKIV